MTRITMTHGNATIVDEYAGPIEGLRERVALIRAALAEKDEGERLKDEVNFDPQPIPVEPAPPPPPPKPATVVTSPGRAPYTVSTAPRPIEPWTGKSFFCWAKTTPGALDFAKHYGAQHGFPRTILQWSPAMCGQAHTAWKAERSVA